MIAPRLFLCSNYQLPAGDQRQNGREISSLIGLGPNANVNIRIEDVAKIFLEHLSPRLIDLLEIASYVYSADCSVRRGSDWTDEKSTEAWSRDFHFIIPVRDVDFWQQNKIRDSLIKALNFLANDNYAFDFVKLQSEEPIQEYLELSANDNWPFSNTSRVLMFSGGLDSLAGAVMTASNNEQLVLVSHRPMPSLSKRQRELFNHLKSRFQTPMIHIPVWINKNKSLGVEHTQRTRSFLFSAIGTVVGASIRAEGVRFFENGIVSLNLPVADEVLRARASRTTHPYALSLFSQLYSDILDRDFLIDNPFLFHTKSDVIEEIAKYNASELIQYTCSCAHTGFFKSKTQWHCGTCSQCIDRRIAILAAGQGAYDAEHDYVTNTFTGKRKEGYEQNMAVGYARHAIELSKMSDEEIGHRFNLELTRAARSFSNRREVIDQLIDIHKRHGEKVSQVLQQQMQSYSGHLLNGALDQTSMLGLIAGREHLTSSWTRYADRVTSLLQNGIPVACQTHKPKNEPHLQEICDGILKAQDNDLIREFPFMRWSSSMTKPDWSSEELKLWVELKYVRQKSDVRTITEDISSDITKYGDNKRRVLYIIYDPDHLITDQKSFAEPIASRETMAVSFVR